MKNTTRFCVAILLALAANRGCAQENASKPVVPEHSYHLLFRLEEVDEGGKVINTRAYTTTVDTAETRTASIRSGTRIPVVTNTGKGDVTYLDLGFSVDAREAVEKEGKLQLYVTATQSSIASTTVNQVDPVVRENKWNAKVLVPLDKATVLFSSDNLENKGGMRLEVTATRTD
jgi:hypothetical protein